MVSSMLIEAKHTQAGRLTYIRKLDQLSDLLCRVIDVAEFIRVVHPSEKWVDSAQRAHEQMFEYMNELNTNVELYQMLARVLDLDVVEELSDEEVEVGRYLRQDFERSGVAMDPETRRDFVVLTQEISILGSQFSHAMKNVESYWCKVPREEFDKLAPGAIKDAVAWAQKGLPKGADVNIPITGTFPYTILTECESSEVRRRVWVALHNSSRALVDILESILRYRAILARIMGYASFGEYQLEHKMAKSPANVMKFLTNLQESLLAKSNGVMAELRSLHRHKPQYQPLISDKRILKEMKPWDRDFLMAREAEAAAEAAAETASVLDSQSELPSEEFPAPFKLDVVADRNAATEKAGEIDAAAHSVSVSDAEIAPYLSVGTIMAGLDKLFRSIYNITLRPATTHPGETWELHVRKLSYVDLSSGEVLGHLYVDFWLAKVMPSHFAITCLRELNTEIGTESALEMRSQVALNPDGNYQLPVIALVCNFTKASSLLFDLDCPTLLTLDQVDTIFHEMGHATHSVLARTRLHNLSGTRCQTDFVELPSVLMELFSHDPRVLGEVARHYETGEKVPAELLKRHLAKRNSLHHTETYMQVKMAVLDQRLHGPEVAEAIGKSGEEQYDSTKTYHAVEKEMLVFADEYSTWHAKFPHLFSYGAVYYSYLLDRAIAEKVWKGLFEKDPWSRAAGDKYRRSILSWGGTRDPWHCVADALDQPELRRGDAHAMEMIADINL